MEIAAYRRLQAAWVSDNSGSSMEEPLLAMLPLPLMILILGAFYPKMSGFFLQFIFLVMPMIINFTALSYHLRILPITITLCAVYICFKRKRLSNILSSIPDRKPPWITNFRAFTNLATIICILAVDLNIFPRKFAKTEVQGFGAMDLGVGFYVVCNGLVHKANAFKKEAFDVFTLLILGAVRLIGVRSLDYQEHVSEYGVHWNFFFTLAVCRLVSVISTRYLRMNSLYLAIIFGTFHHAILSSGVQDWVLSSTPRDNLLAANREGVASVLGYVSIYYFAAAYRSYTNYSSIYSQLKKTFLLSLVAWLATNGCKNSLGVSRRLCNIGYIAWTLAVAGSVVLILMLVDIALRWIYRPRVPSILSAINERGLFFFLLGNIVTGVVNVNVQTLLLSTVQSYCLLVSYTCFVIFVTYKLPRHGSTI